MAGDPRNKAADDLSTRQRAEMTGINQADCSQTLGERERLGVIVGARGEFGQGRNVIVDPRPWKECPLVQRRPLRLRSNGNVMLFHHQQDTAAKDYNHTC